MAKRELSATLKNLKFMQRGVKKEEKPKVEEQVKIPEENFGSPHIKTQKCKVIMEGNPHPGAIKGRMSFLSFNPCIDKLNEEATNPCEPKFSTASTGDRRTSERENGSSSLGMDDSSLSPGSGSDGDHKRKQPEDVTGTPPYPSKAPRNVNEFINQGSSSNNRSGSRKNNQKRDKLDWNLLRPPKVPNREG